MLSGSSKMGNKEYETNSIIFSITTGYYPLEDFLYKQFLSNGNTCWYIHEYKHVHIHTCVYVYDWEYSSSCNDRH